jgi:hypothetical protein
MVATASVEELQIADCVMSRVDPPLYVAVAANCSPYPRLIEIDAGAMAIEIKLACPTVIVVDAEMEFEVAETVAVPCPELVASPLLPTALLMIATAASEELHVTVDVRSCVLPSVYVPVAVNCCVVPRAIVGICGLIAIDTSTAGFTTNVALELIEPELIPIVVVPVPSVLASPAVPLVLLIVATVATVELQWPLCVRSCVVPSVNVPVAVNCCVAPSAIAAVGGLIAIDTSVAVVTVSWVDALIVPEVAVILAEPIPTLCANPGLLIVATDSVSDVHVAVLVRFCVLPSV